MNLTKYLISEELENFRHKIYKFSDILGTVENYSFFDCFMLK